MNEFSVLIEGLSANVDPGPCEDPWPFEDKTYSKSRKTFKNDFYLLFRDVSPGSSESWVLGPLTKALDS